MYAVRQGNTRDRPLGLGTLLWTTIAKLASTYVGSVLGAKRLLSLATHACTKSGCPVDVRADSS